MFFKKKLTPKTFFVKKIVPHAKLPTKSTEGAACWDFYTPDSVIIPPNTVVTISLGIQVAFPKEYGLFFFEKSGIASKTFLVKKAGVIDSDYRGIVQVVFQNMGDTPVSFIAGEKIIQGTLLHLDDIEVVEVDNLPSTLRGSGGFGSTGRF